MGGEPLLALQLTLTRSRITDSRLVHVARKLFCVGISFTVFRESFLVSFHLLALVIIYSRVYQPVDLECSRPEDGLRCWMGIEPPPKLKLMRFSHQGKTTTRHRLNLCIPIMPFTPDMSDQHVCQHVCLTMLPNESPCASIVSTLHMGNFQELFLSGYLCFSAFKASAGPHCVLVVDPGSGMITAE